MAVLHNSMVRGVSVSSGIAQGAAYVLSSVDKTMIPRRALKAGEVEAEVARFDAALAAAEKELLTLREDVARRIGAGEADIFAAQALVVRDHGLRGQIVAAVQQNRVNVEAAVVDVIEHLDDATVRSFTA